MVYLIWFTLFIVTIVLGIGVAFYIRHLYTTKEVANDE